jgi:hypothetical protein
MRTAWTVLGKCLVAVAFAVEGTILLGSLLALRPPSSGSPFLWPFVLSAVLLQIWTIRKPRAPVVVAAAFFVLLPPYCRFACPESHVASSAESVGGEILDHLRRGAVDEAASHFCNDRCRRDFLAAVEEHGLVGLRSWTFVTAHEGWHHEGTAEFRVVRSDGEKRHLFIDVATRYFNTTVAESLGVGKDE